MKRPCPKCGVAAEAIRLPRKEYPTSATVLFGGFLLAWIFEFSRKPRWRCSGCGADFYRYTPLSIFFRILWVIFVSALLIGILTFFLELFRNH